MIRPVLMDDAFVADVECARREGAGPHVWWLGQSGYLVHAAGRTVLFDPYLSDSLTVKYSGTDKPHVRMTERVVAPERLAGVDLVTSSHLHTDHLDAETLRGVVKASPALVLVCPESQRQLSRDRSGLPEERILGLDVATPGMAAAPGVASCVEWRGIRVEAVPAAHETLERDRSGRMVYLGFIVRWGGWSFYHSGDTVPFDGMEDLLRGRGIDIAFLPINGRAVERRVAGNLWGREAARLARSAGFGIAVPGHYEMFEFNTASPEEFVGECTALGQEFRILRAGERWSVGAKD